MTDRDIYNLIVSSVGYKTTVGPVDKSKVQKAADGFPSLRPSSRLGRAAWELARRFGPLPPPPPPPPFLKVAPRAAYKEGDSDARFSLTSDGVTLRLGVFRRPDGKYSDDSGAVYTTLDGLDESGVRSGAPAVTGAKQIDGRDLWQLPLMGDPTKNTGSWSV